METTITKVWKTEEELIQEFYQMKEELESAYGQELQLIVEEDEKELIIGFSTRIDGYFFEISTLYRIHQGQEEKIYENVKPYWYASRSGRFIGHGSIESPDEAMRVVMASVEILSEVGLEIDDTKPTIEHNGTTMQMRYTYRHPEENSELSKVFTMEEVECGLTLQFRKELEDRGYELVDTSVEDVRLFKAALLQYRDYLRTEQDKANQGRLSKEVNRFFDNGKAMGYRDAGEKLDEIFQEFL